MSTIGKEVKGFDNNYKLPRGQECPQVKKHGIWICVKENWSHCPFPKKCWMEMTPKERRRVSASSPETQVQETQEKQCTARAI